jgi:hypothetical protein
MVSNWKLTCQPVAVEYPIAASVDSAHPQLAQANATVVHAATTTSTSAPAMRHWLGFICDFSYSSCCCRPIRW